MKKKILISFCLVFIFVASTYSNAVTASENMNQNMNVDYSETCGSVVLQKVLKDHGIEASLEELDQLSKADESGTSMLNLIAVAKTKGLNLEGKKVSAIHLQKGDIVLLRFENENHYAVILNVNVENVTIYNPFPSEHYGNELTIPFEGFEEVYMGYAITNESNPHGKYISKDQLSELKGKGGIGTLISKAAQWAIKNGRSASKVELENAMREISKALDFVKKNTRKALERITEEIALQSAYESLHHIYCERFGC